MFKRTVHTKKLIYHHCSHSKGFKGTVHQKMKIMSSITVTVDNQSCDHTTANKRHFKEQYTIKELNDDVIDDVIVYCHCSQSEVS